MTATTGAGPYAPAVLLAAVAAGHIRQTRDGRAIWHADGGDRDVTWDMRLLASTHGAVELDGSRYTLTAFGRYAHQQAGKTPRR